jgi:hypothetical protein
MIEQCFSSTAYIMPSVKLSCFLKLSIYTQVTNRDDEQINSLYMEDAYCLSFLANQSFRAVGHALVKNDMPHMFQT